MHVEEVSGTRVEFPYEPYECQRKYMKSVIDAISTSSNAALESPTGTGKTLSLLCASLAWLEKFKAVSRHNIIDSSGIINPVAKNENSQLYPTIIYASRTHSQLQQVVRELNKTRYKYMKTCVLASRDQLCINEKVKNEQDSQIKGQVCRNLVKSHKCVYANGLEKDLANVDEMYQKESPDVMDIEDLVTAAKKFKHCPYFRTQSMLENADLVLLPYNYVFDPKVRRALKVHLKGNILIIDEAHNLESTCEDSVSIEWSTSDNALCIKEAQHVLNMLVDDEETRREEGENSKLTFDKLIQDETKKAKKEAERVSQADVAQLLERLLLFEKVLDAFAKEETSYANKVFSLDGSVYPGEKMVQLLESAEFLRTQRDAVLNVIDMIGMFLAQQAGKNSGIWAERGKTLADFAVLISRVFTDSFEVAMGKTIEKTSANEASKKFLLYVERDEDAVKLKYWCFSASLAMKLVSSRGIRSIIVTSGTLAPLPQFLTSMGIPFRFQLENEHIAKQSQVLIGALRRSSTKIELLGTFKNRTNMSYIDAMGRTLLQTMEVTPQGMLVFFASYSQMYSMIDDLKKQTYSGTTLWSLLERHKKIFVEPKGKTELPEMLSQFDQMIRSGRGAAFFAVCRGKISEGIDLPDSHCRAVFLCGIPYSPPNDPRVVLKKHYLGTMADKNSLNPDEWYRLEGLKAVNQAIGRVIRHKEDFGIVVLADARFCTIPKAHLSAWIRPGLVCYNDPDSFFEGCARFFTERGLLIKRSNEKLSKEPSKFELNQKVNKTRPNLNGTLLNWIKKKDDSSLIESLKTMYEDDKEVKPHHRLNNELSKMSQPQRPKIKVIIDNRKNTLPAVVSSNYQEAKNVSTPSSQNSTQGKIILKRNKTSVVQTSASSLKMVPNVKAPMPFQKDVYEPPSKKPSSTSTNLPIIMAEYKKKMSKLPKSIKESIIQAQRKYMTTSLLSDVIPSLKEAIPYDSNIFTDFYHFTSDSNKSEFEAICRSLGLSCKK